MVWFVWRGGGNFVPAVYYNPIIFKIDIGFCELDLLEISRNLFFEIKKINTKLARSVEFKLFKMKFTSTFFWIESILNKNIRYSPFSTNYLIFRVSSKVAVAYIN